MIITDILDNDRQGDPIRKIPGSLDKTILSNRTSSKPISGWEPINFFPYLGALSSQKDALEYEKDIHNSLLFSLHQFLFHPVDNEPLLSSTYFPSASSN